MIKIILIALIASTQLYGGVIEFEDKEFERFLLTQICADTSTMDGTLISPDLNGNGKIDTDEAELIVELKFSDFSRVFDIKSVMDLNHFPNLEKLTLIYLDSLTEFSDLKLENLRELYIADCRVLHHIDISNLINLTKSIRIEGLTQLHYLNLKNGSVADEFSMFYTINVDYACIDSIEKELEILINSGTMAEGKTPSIDCELTTNVNTSEGTQYLNVYPNPTNSFVNVKSDCNSAIVNYQIKDINGAELLGASVENKTGGVKVDFSNYTAGVYFITIDCNNHPRTIKVVRE